MDFRKLVKQIVQDTEAKGEVNVSLSIWTEDLNLSKFDVLTEEIHRALISEYPEQEGVEFDFHSTTSKDTHQSTAKTDVTATYSGDIFLVYRTTYKDKKKKIEE